MQLLIDDIYILAYCKVGCIDGGIEIDESILPSNFFTEFDTNKFLYQNGIISENPDYVPVKIESESFLQEPSLEEKINQLETENQMLKDCILEMSEIIYGE